MPADPDPAGRASGGPSPAVDRIAEEVVGSPAQPGRTIILIDGRSGSGKSTLAALLAPRIGAELVRLDDIYPGWGGLAEASRMVVDDVLRRGEWTRWDWQGDRPAERHTVDATKPLIVEGCGSISRRSSRLATGSIWVELDAATRRRNAIARDGDVFAPFWDMWARQEEELIAEEDPRSLARMVVGGMDLSRIR